MGSLNARCISDVLRFLVDVGDGVIISRVQTNVIQYQFNNEKTDQVRARGGELGSLNARHRRFLVNLGDGITLSRVQTNVQHTVPF